MTRLISINGRGFLSRVISGPDNCHQSIVEICCRALSVTVLISINCGDFLSRVISGPCNFHQLWRIAVTCYQWRCWFPSIVKICCHVLSVVLVISINLGDLLSQVISDSEYFINDKDLKNTLLVISISTIIYLASFVRVENVSFFIFSHCQSVKINENSLQAKTT